MKHPAMIIPSGFSQLFTAVFVYTTAVNSWEKPDGMIIAGCFIAAILVSSGYSRWYRSTELRKVTWRFKDETSELLWHTIKTSETPIIIPHRPGRRDLADKEKAVRKEHRIPKDVEVVFIEVGVDDPSDFHQDPMVSVVQDNGRMLVEIKEAASIPHVIASAALELGKHGAVPELLFGWDEGNPTAANLNFLISGEGNVPWMVKHLLDKAPVNGQAKPRVTITE